MMRKADFQARVKKIEIVNKVLAEGWAQSIRVNLDDIELTNENLLELRQFRPNEPVSVIIEPVELNLLEIAAFRINNEGRPALATNQNLDENQAENEEDGFLTLTEEEEGSAPPPCKVIREFKL